MLKPSLMCNKFYFLLKFRALLLSAKYVSLYRVNLLGLRFLVAASQGLILMRVGVAELQSLLPREGLKGVLSPDLVAIGCDEYSPFEDKEGLYAIHCFFFSGHLVNAAFINRLNMVYNYYKGNYNCYISFTKKSINLYLYGAFFYFTRFVLALNFAKQKNKK